MVKQDCLIFLFFIIYFFFNRRTFFLIVIFFSKLSIFFLFLTLFVNSVLVKSTYTIFFSFAFLKICLSVLLVN